MELNALHIENFGVLHDFNMTFESGINVLYEENGWGKSTLAAFIRVMFYGFDGEKRRGGQSERERFSPWQGGTFGGTLTFTADKKQYRIERYFGQKKREDIFRLYRADTNRECDDFSGCPGEDLFGLDAQSFERTVCIGQGSLQRETPGTPPAVQAQIGDLAQEAADMGNYDTAMQQLGRAASSLSPTRASGRIRKMETELSSLDRTAARAEQIEAAARSDDAAVREKTKALERLEERHRELTRSLAELHSASETAALRGRYTDISRREKEAVSKYRECRSFFPGPVPKKSLVDRMIRLSGQIQRMQAAEPHAGSGTHLPAGLGALFLAAAIFLFFSGHRAASVFCAAAALAALFTGIRKRHADSRQDLHDDCAEIDRFLEKLGFHAFFRSNPHRDTEKLTEILLEIRDRQQQLALQKEELKAVQVEKLSFEESHDISVLSADTESAGHPEQELDELPEQYRQQRAALEESRRRLAEETRLLRECRQAQSRARALRTQLHVLQEKYRILQLTAQYLQQARDDFNGQYMTPLLDSFNRYYGMIAGIFPRDFAINADLDISVRAKGALRSSRSQSAGTRDLIALCRRMAIIDAMYRGKQPFVILDDPFVNFDDTRMEGALRFLDEIAQDRQVIYLTCQSARLP